MRKIYLLTTFLSLLGCCSLLRAQQDAMFTKYMFNQLSYNPAYAGSYEFLSINLLYRNQWWAFDGAPQSQTLTAHTPLGKNIGVGLTLFNDKVGPSGSTGANLIYAYHIPFRKGKLSIAIQGGVMNWRANFEELAIRDFNDPSYQELRPNLWLPNFGAGVYFYADHFYVGFSVPRILNSDLRKNEDPNNPVSRWAMLYRHYFFTAGGLVELTPRLKFKPSMLVKNVGLFGEFNRDQNSLNYIGAPTEFELDASLLFHDALWIGLSFRSAIELFNKKSSMDSADIWAAYYLKNGLRIGLAYDYTLTELQRFADGSFEVSLGYDFYRKPRKMLTPRYF